VEVRHINRSSSATRHPKVYTSTTCASTICASTNKSTPHAEPRPAIAKRPTSLFASWGAMVPSPSPAWPFC
jgi:hypothetical protein